MAKSKAISFKEEFGKYIKLNERFYIKPCDADPSSYDLYELKVAVNKQRHPNGKMDDVGYGMTLERAIFKACHRCSEEEAVDLKELIAEFKKVSEEIIRNIKSLIN